MKTNTRQPPKRPLCPRCDTPLLNEPTEICEVAPYAGKRLHTSCIAALDVLAAYVSHLIAKVGAM